METKLLKRRKSPCQGIDSRLLAEIEYRKSLGQVQVTMAEWSERIKLLGYRFERSMDCRSNSQYMTGPRAGMTYPCLSLYIVEIDTGIGWCNVAGRRDARWEQLKAFRETCFAVVNGFLAEW